MLDPKADEQARQEYEGQCAADDRRELEQLRRAVEMCITAGHLKRSAFDKAIEFVQEFQR